MHAMSRFRKCTSVVAGLLLLSAAAAIWMGAGQIVRPSRGEISACSGEWTAHPREHGIRFLRDITADERLPYLIVEPDAEAGPAARGRLVREQIESMGLATKPHGEIVGTLVLLHGRTGRKEAMPGIAERFCAAGFRCVIPDLPAHGESPIGFQTFGATEFEGGIARTVLAEASRKHGFAPRPAGLFGMSMGGAFAVSAAGRHPEDWSAVVLLSTFDSLPALVRAKSRSLAGPLGPILAPPMEAVARWRSGVDPSEIVPAEWARRISAPVLVAHGTVDPLIGPARGRALFEAAGSREKRWVEVAGGSHERVLTTPMPLYATMSAWFLRMTMPLAPRPALRQTCPP